MTSIGGSCMTGGRDSSPIDRLGGLAAFIFIMSCNSPKFNPRISLKAAGASPQFGLHKEKYDCPRL
jgi:hypothetical protein